MRSVFNNKKLTRGDSSPSVIDTARGREDFEQAFHSFHLQMKETLSPTSQPNTPSSPPSPSTETTTETTTTTITNKMTRPMSFEASTENNNEEPCPKSPGSSPPKNNAIPNKYVGFGSSDFQKKLSKTRSATFLESVKNMFGNKKASATSTISSPSPPLSTENFVSEVEREQQESNSTMDMDQILRKYMTSVLDCMVFLKKENTLFIKKPKGHFKERWAQITNENNIDYLLVWRNANKEGKPLIKYTLQDFKVQSVGMTTLSLRDLKREKKSKKSNVFAILFLQETDPKAKEAIFCTPDDADFRDWIEVLNLIYLKNFALLEWRYPLSKVESLEAHINDELHLFEEQQHQFTTKYGDEKYKLILNDYHEKIQQMHVRSVKF